MITSAAFAPATIANLSVGYDTLGLALHSIGDEVHLGINSLGQHRIISIKSDIELPFDIQKNSCTAVIMAMQADGYGADIFVDLTLKKGFKAGSGLGSSAASSVAAAVAFNQLLEHPLPKENLLKYCAEGERIACGSPILDNVAASLFGGLILIHNQSVIHLPTPTPLYAVAIFQQIEIRTEDARAVLPKRVPISTATEQMSNIALFVHAVHTQNWQFFQQSFHDLLAEPYRKKLIPNFEQLQQISEKHQALGFGISGSGPTVFCLCNELKQAEQIKAEMVEITQINSFETISFLEDLAIERIGAKSIEYEL